MEAELVEQAQARHRKELKELQGRITNRKKNATKKTRKGVADECAQMESDLRQKQGEELALLSGGTPAEATLSDDDDANEKRDGHAPNGLGKLESKVEETLERAAEKLHIHSHSNSDPAATDASGKKRNRQKERMARRAAEQEAVAQQAEQEASTMTDHRARESEYMRKMFANYNLKEKDIEPDGHCLFSAVADQLSQNAIPLDDRSTPQILKKEPAYRTVRRAAADFMEQHADDFAPFLEEEGDADFSAYAARMRDTADWGGQLELMALARRYGAEIRVIQDGRTEHIGEEEGKASGKTLWLAYYRHGYGLGEHYNSLRKTGASQG